jgi:hypothetical protein
MGELLPEIYPGTPQYIDVISYWNPNRQAGQQVVEETIEKLVSTPPSAASQHFSLIRSIVSRLACSDEGSWQRILANGGSQVSPGGDHESCC